MIEYNNIESEDILSSVHAALDTWILINNVRDGHQVGKLRKLVEDVYRLGGNVALVKSLKGSQIQSERSFVDKRGRNFTKLNVMDERRHKKFDVYVAEPQLKRLVKGDSIRIADSRGYVTLSLQELFPAKSGAPKNASEEG